MCKPKECCEKGHRHFIIDAESHNGICLKPTDDCKAHCVTSSTLIENERRTITTCTKGCNDIIKVPGSLITIQRQDKEPKRVQLFDIVVCQADKAVTCRTPERESSLFRRSRLGGALGDDTSSALQAAMTPMKECSSTKRVTTEAVCPDMDEDASSVIFSSGPSCILDVLTKIQCDRDTSGQCIKNAAGTFVGCVVLDLAPFVCESHVFEHLRNFLSCSCQQVQQEKDMCDAGGAHAAIGYQPLERHKQACETVAGTF